MFQRGGYNPPDDPDMNQYGPRQAALSEEHILRILPRPLKFSLGLFFLAFCFGAFSPVNAQSTGSLAERNESVMHRPEFAHANFGIEFYSLDTGKVVYALNADKLFVPASTTKLLTEGALLAKRSMRLPIIKPGSTVCPFDSGLSRPVRT